MLSWKDEKRQEFLALAERIGPLPVSMLALGEAYNPAPEPYAQPAPDLLAVAAPVEPYPGEPSTGGDRPPKRR